MDFRAFGGVWPKWMNFAANCNADKKVSVLKLLSSSLSHNTNHL
jgi:hypothetical protein